jgi:hypothetical protein
MAHYLTCDPHLFTAEERMVRHGPHPDKDIWWVDALVVDPWQKTFWLGEATYNPKPTPLVRKVWRFYERKDEVMKQLALEGLTEGWSVRPWLFNRRRPCDSWCHACRRTATRRLLTLRRQPLLGCTRVFDAREPSRAGPTPICTNDTRIEPPLRRYRSSKPSSCSFPGDPTTTDAICMKLIRLLGTLMKTAR